MSIELEETNPSWVRSARVRREFSLSVERVQYISSECALPVEGNVHSHERVSVHCAERVSPVDGSCEMVVMDSHLVATMSIPAYIRLSGIAMAWRARSAGRAQTDM